MFYKLDKYAYIVPWKYINKYSWNYIKNAEYDVMQL